MEPVIEAELVPATGVGTNQLSAITRGELDVQIQTAKAYPRDRDKFIADATEWATADADTANDCVYEIRKKDRDGNEVPIRGPSIRMAEILAQAYGNLRVASRLVAEMERFVVVEAVAHDLERNNAQRAEVAVSIYSTKWKRRFSQDVIQSNILAAQAKARRNAILAVVPGAWTKKIMAAVEAKNMEGSSNLEARVENMVSYITQRLKVTVERVLARCGRSSVKDITSDDLVTIRSLVQDIQEDTLTVAQAFPDAKPEEKSEASAAQAVVDDAAKPEPKPKRKAKRRTRKAKPKEEPKPEPKAHPWDEAEGAALDEHIAHLEDAAASLEGDIITQAQSVSKGALSPDASPEQLRVYCDALHARIVAATK